MKTEFPDHRVEMFGRKRDVRRLLARVRHKGFTGLAGRPEIGKTWTFLETARCLSSEGYLVGYHEANNSEETHFLYALQDLYTRWLANASFTDEFKKLWADYGKDLITNVGGMLGHLLPAIANLPSKRFSNPIRTAFSSLSNMQKRLASGGLDLAPLAYDQAKDLMTFIHRVSGKPLVLILDAWEAASSVKHEARLFEAVLNHLADWPPGHVFLGIRHPDPLGQGRAEAMDSAGLLARGSEDFSLIKLSPMKLDEAGEKKRLLVFLGHEVPLSKTMTEQDVLGSIQGFPGVLKRWRNRRRSPETVNDLHQKAKEAQTYRYPEFDVMFSELPDPELEFFARVAVLPRLNRRQWELFRELILGDIPEEKLDDFIRTSVFEEEDFPSYGHDSRHHAAKEWFVKNYRRRLKRIIAQMVEILVKPIKRPEPEYLENSLMLGSFKGLAERLDLEARSFCCIAVARSFFSDLSLLTAPEFDRQFRIIREKSRNLPFLNWGLINRGTNKAASGDRKGGRADYSAVIAMEDAPADQVATALLNRGIDKGASGDREGGMADYSAVIAMDGAPTDVVAKALLNRGNDKGASGDREGGMADYSAVIAMKDAPTGAVATALLNRGIDKGASGDKEGGMADYSAVIAMEDAPTDVVATAHYNRACSFSLNQRVDSALTELKYALELEQDGRLIELSRKDPDFKNLRGLPAFDHLINEVE